MSASSSPPVPIALSATPFTKRLDRRVLHFVRKHEALRTNGRVLVAVSGGPDSTALLIVLARLRAELEVELIAAHFNHMLRTRKEAQADTEFVTGIARELEIPIVTGQADVRAHARRAHRSLEDAARRLRYAFLAEQAALADASCVAVGHTLDDQAETVLLHLIRGSGLEGLAGIRPRSTWPFDAGPGLARPLLSIRRQETERYCRELGVAPRKDPTNDLPVAIRNRMRQELIPVLRTLNPRIEEALARFADAAARDADHLEGLAREHFAGIASPGPQTVAMARTDLLAAAPAISSRLFRFAFEHVTGTTADLEATHIDALFDSLGKPPGRLSLPGAVTAITNSRSLVVRRCTEQPARRMPKTPLAIPGQTVVCGRIFLAQIVPVPSNLAGVAANEAFLDAGKAGTELAVRARHPGDRIRPLGLGGEKKLQDILVDAKVPADERDAVPIICGPDGIIWVVGHCIDERFALGENSRQALHLVVGSAANC